MNSNFEEQFKDWVDLDFAMYFISKKLGIISEELSFIECKKIYWANNIYSIELEKIIKSLINIGVLEFNEDELKLKYNTDYKMKMEK